MSDARDERRRPGRPREPPGTSVSTYIRVSDYDKLVRLALKEERSLSSLVRDLLRLKLK